MWLLEPEKKGDKSKNARQLALLTAIPAILIVSPLVGFFIGQWVDKRLGTAPLFVIVGLIFGFVSAAKEIRLLLKRSTEENNKNEKNK